MQIKKELINEIHQIIAAARERAVRSVDTERVLMYWQIGKVIFEEEQQGKDRARYGEYLIKSLAKELEPLYGSGFSYRQLNFFRQFYRIFPIVNALRTQLSWTHYKHLISINNPDKRDFYIAESTKNNWAARQLERQINSQLFEIKTAKLTHQDIGQLQMYVNYYDRFEKQDFENPTMGILLCADKNDTMVRITLPENNKTIIASKYQLYLPTEQQLIDEVKKELEKHKT